MGKHYACIDNAKSQRREVYFDKEFVMGYSRKQAEEVKPWHDWAVVAGKVSSLPDSLIADMLIGQFDKMGY